MKFVALVPLKMNSQRVPRKNFLLLAGKPLFMHIFETLLRVPMIDRVVCWSSDEIFKDFLPKGVEFIKRDSYLDGDNIKARDLFSAAAKQIDTDYFVLSHATAPFISSSSISKGINAILEGYDSSFAVKEIKNYCWYKNQTLNYSLNNPVKTQDLESIYMETSGFFIYHRDLILNEGRRIGYNPKMIKVSDIEAIDIDEKSDFEFAKLLENQLYRQYSPEYKLLQRKYKHVIFDMDGVLVNSLVLMEKAWEACGGSKYAEFSEYKKLIGLPFIQICKKLNINENYIANIEKKYFEYTSKHFNEIEVYEGVNELLNILKNENIKISIVSSKNYENTKQLVDENKLPVDCIIAPKKPMYKGKHKPSGEPLLASCLEVHVLPQETLFVGDMLVDYNASIDANIDFVYAEWGYGNLEHIVELTKIDNILKLKIVAK